MASTMDEDVYLIREADERGQLKELVRTEGERDCHGGHTTDLLLPKVFCYS